MSYFKFWEACEKGDISYVLNTISSIENINKHNTKGWNAIILAAFNHHIEIVEMLLQHGALINSGNANGTTVFMYAKTKVLENDNYFFLDLLIENGANINLRDTKNNWTVLDYSKQIGNAKLIHYLIEKGAQ